MERFKKKTRVRERKGKDNEVNEYTIESTIKGVENPPD